MAFLMFLASTGLSMDMHYCQNQLQGISLIGKAKSCHDRQRHAPCHKKKKTCHHSNGSAAKADADNCCHNETIAIEKLDLDATAKQIATYQDIPLDFLAALAALYLFDYCEQADFQPYVHYKPPLPDRDVQVLYQTFLI